VPRKTFHCRRGVRQGDPLSPLLFVIPDDILRSMVNKAKDDGRLKLPIPQHGGGDFPIVQYADGTLLIMEGCPNQLLVLKELLHAFAESTGLKVNYSKSMMVPLNVSDERLDILTSIFGCQKGSMPFLAWVFLLGQLNQKLMTFYLSYRKLKGDWCVLRPFY